MAWRIGILLWVTVLLRFSAVCSAECPEALFLFNTFNQGTAFQNLHNISDKKTPILRAFIVNDSLAENFRSLKSFVGKPLDATRFELEINEVVRDFNRRGFPFFKIMITPMFVSEDSLDLLVTVDNYKEQVTIDTIVLLTDAGISKSFLLGRLKIREGDLFNILEIKEFELKIKRHPFLSLQGPLVTRFSTSGAILELPVKGRVIGSFSGIVGLATNSLTGKTLLTGDLNLSIQNGFKNGELLELSWKRPSQLSQFLEINTEYPFIFGTQYGVTASFELQKRDSSYLKIGSSFHGLVNIGYNTHFSAGIDYNAIDFLVSNFSKKNVHRLLYSAQGNYYWNNNRGVERSNFLEVKVGLGERRLRDSTGGKNILLDIRLIGEYNLNISQNSVLKVSVSFGSLQTKAMLQSEELNLLGGVNSIRGFDEKSLYVKDWAYITTEFHWFFEEKSTIFPFVQSGRYILIPDSFIVTRDFISFGIGTGVNTSAGKLSVYWALGKNFREPLVGRNSKIHIGYRVVF